MSATAGTPEATTTAGGDAASPAGPSPDSAPQPQVYEPPVEETHVGPQDDVDDAPVADPPVVDVEEELEPRTLPVERVIVDKKGQSATYTQEGLSYFGKIELYGLLGRAVKIAMAGELGLDINDLMGLTKPKDLLASMMSQLPDADTSPDADKNQDLEIEASKMLAAFAEVVSVAPDMLMEAYCIVLAIPKGHRKWAMDWGLPSISDEMGQDILHVFIDQNWGVMEDFFARELPKLFKRVAKARERHKSAGGQSKP